MTPTQFTAWLAAMKAAGLIQSDADAARLLDVSANSVVTFKKRGGNRRLALACASLLAGLQPYGEKITP